MRRLVLLVVMLGLAVAGCATVSGQPTAARSDRPRDIRLDSIDPCSLFTPDVQKQLGITRPLKPERSTDFVYQGEVPSCGSRGEGPPAFSVGVSFGLRNGIELFSPDRVAGALTSKRIQDFPALLLKPSRFADNCGMIIDVAPGQSIAVIYADGGNKPPTSQDELCSDVERAADLTLSELVRQA